MTPEEYFAWEEQQLEKHEYINGEIYAMSDGSVNHGRIALRAPRKIERFYKNAEG